MAVKLALVCVSVNVATVPVTLTFAVAVAVDVPGAYCTLTVHEPPGAKVVVAVQVPPAMTEKVPPAPPTFVIVGAPPKANGPDAIVELVIVTKPVFVVVLAVVVVNAGAGPLNASGPAVTTKFELAVQALVATGVVMVTQWFPSAEFAGTMNVAVAVVELTTTTLVITGPFEPGWNMVAGAAKFVPVTVTVKVVPRAPEAGLNEVIAGRAKPVPLRATGEPFTVTFAVIVAVPVAGPAAVGVNTMPIVQVAPAPRVPMQVPPAPPAGRENGAVTATVIPVAVAVPSFSSVSVCAALVVPTRTLPKFSASGVTTSDAVIPFKC